MYKRQDYLLPLRDGRKGAAGGGGVQLQPAASRGGRKALDPQHLPALGRCEQPLCGSLQLLWGEVQFQKATGGKGRVLVKMQLFACLLYTSGCWPAFRNCRARLTAW